MDEPAQHDHVQHLRVDHAETDRFNLRHDLTGLEEFVLLLPVDQSFQMDLWLIDQLSVDQGICIGHQLGVQFPNRGRFNGLDPIFRF